MATTKRDRREFIIDVDQARISLSITPPQLTDHLSESWETTGSAGDEWVKDAIRLLARASGKQSLHSRLTHDRPIRRYPWSSWKVGATPALTLGDTFALATERGASTVDIAPPVPAGRSGVDLTIPYEALVAEAADLALRAVALHPVDRRLPGAPLPPGAAL